MCAPLCRDCLFVCIRREVGNVLRAWLILACVCMPRDLSDEGLLGVCICVLKHVPKRCYMCVHACVHVYAYVMTGGRGHGGQNACTYTWVIIY